MIWCMVNSHTRTATCRPGPYGIVLVLAVLCAAIAVPGFCGPTSEAGSDSRTPVSQTDYYTIPEIPYRVRYLVDAESAALRSGVMDPAVLDVPPEISRLMLDDPASGIPRLARFLRDDGGAAGPVVDHYHLVKRIHDWITRSVAYDTQAAFGFSHDSQDPAVFMRYPEGPRAVCRGFADLFVALAVEAGLQAQRISGVCRTYWSALDRYGTHAWNAVRINGRWYVIDTSGDARVRHYPDGRSEIGPYRDEQLFISPEAQLLTYRANIESEQLIADPIDFEAFVRMPSIDAGFLRAGASFQSVGVLQQRTIAAVESPNRTNFIDRYASSDGIWQMTFIVPAGWEIYAYLKDDQERDLGFRTLTEFAERPDGSYEATIRCSVPSPGRHSLTVRARRMTELGSFTIYTCLIDESERGGELLPEPGAFVPAMRSVKYDLDHGAVSRVDGKYVFDLDHGPDLDFFVRCESPDGTKIDGRIESSVMGAGSQRYFFSPPDSGTWIIRTYARAAGSDDNYDRTGLLRLEASQSTSPGYPLFTPRFERLFFERNLTIVRGLELVPGSDRLYSVVVDVPDDIQTRNYLLECDSDQRLLRDGEGNLIFATGHYSRVRDGSTVEFFFSPGAAQSPDHVYRARAYLRLDGTNRVILEYLLPAGDGPGDPAPN